MKSGKSTPDVAGTWDPWFFFRKNLVRRARYSRSQDLARATCGADGTVHPSSCDEGADRSRVVGSDLGDTQAWVSGSTAELRRGPQVGPRVRFRSSLLYGTSTPSTKSWITPAANPPESTVSVPAVLISSWSALGLRERTSPVAARRPRRHYRRLHDVDLVVAVGGVDDDLVGLTVALGATGCLRDRRSPW